MAAKKTTAAKPENKRATGRIRKVSKREAQYQIADIKSALMQAKDAINPNRKKLLEIYEYIRKDGHLQSQIKVAKLKVLSEPWLLYSSAETPDLKASQLLANRWLRLVIECILEAELYGFSLVELDAIDPATFMVGKVKNIDREYVSIENQWILLDGTVMGDFLPYGDYKNELDLLEFGDPENYGCLLEASYNVIFKFYSRSDWSRGNEKLAMPILTIEADTNNDTELDRLERQAANFGTDGYIVMQKGDKASILERKSDNFHLSWKESIAYCDEQVSKIINGQTSSSDQKAFVGAAEVQERTMEDFTAARLQNIVDEMKETVLPYLRLKGFNIPEGLYFDYPELIRQRKKKIEGPMLPVPGEVPPAPGDPKPDPANPKKDPKKPRR